MKLESLVIAEQHAAVNTYLGLVHIARHIMGIFLFRYKYLNLFKFPIDVFILSNNIASGFLGEVRAKKGQLTVIKS